MQRAKVNGMATETPVPHCETPVNASRLFEQCILAIMFATSFFVLGMLFAPECKQCNPCQMGEKGQSEPPGSLLSPKYASNGSCVTFPELDVPYGPFRIEHGGGVLAYQPDNNMVRLFNGVVDWSSGTQNDILEALDSSLWRFHKIGKRCALHRQTKRCPYHAVSLLARFGGDIC